MGRAVCARGPRLVLERRGRGRSSERANERKRDTGMARRKEEEEERGRGGEGGETRFGQKFSVRSCSLLRTSQRHEEEVEEQGPGAQNCLPSAFDCLQIAGHSRVSRTSVLLACTQVRRHRRTHTSACARARSAKLRDDAG